MNLNPIKELVAEIQQSIHSLRAGMLHHRCIKMSSKPHNRLFYTVESVGCECGKVFYTKK